MFVSKQDLINISEQTNEAFAKLQVELRKLQEDIDKLKEGGDPVSKRGRPSKNKEENA